MEQSSVEEVLIVTEWKGDSSVGAKHSYRPEDGMEIFHVKGMSDDGYSFALSFGWTPRVRDALHAIDSLDCHQEVHQEERRQPECAALIHERCVEGKVIQEIILHVRPTLMTPIFVTAIGWDGKTRIIGECPCYSQDDAMKRFTDAVYVLI